MRFNYKDEIYKDILINIKEFSLIRYFRDTHHPSIDPDNRVDKDTIHPWPNQYAIDRFHRSDREQFMEALEINNVEILDNDFIFVYLLKRSNYKKDKPDDMLDYLRFKHLRNYFMIRRFKLWAEENERVDITLQYRETFPNKFSNNLRVSNDALIDYLMRHPKRDELTWKIQIQDDHSRYFKIDYTMTDLVFKNHELYFDNYFKLKKKDEVNTAAKTKGYVLESDRAKCKKIVEESYDNFKHLVTDPTLYLEVQEHYERYVTDSIAQD